MKNIAKGRVVEFQTLDKKHNYVAIFDRFEGDGFWVSRFLVRHMEKPTLKNNDGDAGPAMFYAPRYSNIKVLHRKTLP